MAGSVVWRAGEHPGYVRTPLLGAWQGAVGRPRPLQVLPAICGETATPFPASSAVPGVLQGGCNHAKQAEPASVEAAAETKPHLFPRESTPKHIAAAGLAGGG